MFIHHLIIGFTSFKLQDLLLSFNLTLFIWAIYILEVYIVQNAFSMNLDIYQCILIF